MTALRKNPHIYEINLMTWLAHLSHEEKRNITLNDIPRSEWKRLKEAGMDLIWLMGVWERSPYSRMRARNEAGLLKECRTLLDDFTIADIVGSPYSIYNYEPDPAFGTREELQALKQTIEDEGLLLILDFVPNHTACDHPWIMKHPSRYIQEEKTDLGHCVEEFFLSDTDWGEKCIAHGRDPYFHPWNDTAQVNYFNHETVKAMVETLSSLATCCHGLRCDMAMLVIMDIFRETWGTYLEDKDHHPDEFWSLATERLRSAGTPILMLAEVYWGREMDLIDLGFDYVYDKILYDLMVRSDIEGIRDQISLPVSRQEKMIRFLENHDEPRALSVFGPEKIRCAMIIQATLPGMRFWQHGQLEGNRIRVPVQLRREPLWNGDDELGHFSRHLLEKVNHPVFHEGHWELCPTHGWSDNQTHQDLFAWSWKLDEERRLIVVNFSDLPAQGYIELPPDWLLNGHVLRFYDPLKKKQYSRQSREIERSGLFVDLDCGDWHFFIIEYLS